MYYSDKSHVFLTVNLMICLFLWSPVIKHGIYVEAKDKESLHCSSKWETGYLLPCLLLYQQCSACMEKGNLVFPCSLPSNKCFCFALAFALTKMFSFWFQISGTGYAMSMHRSDDGSIKCALVTSGACCLFTDWESLGRPSLHFSWAEARSPCLWSERFLIHFSTLIGGSVCLLPM